MKLTWRIWLMILFLILSLISLFGIPPTFFKEGVLITSVKPNSTASFYGLKEGEIILKINNQKISSVEEFSKIVEGLFVDNSSKKLEITTDGNNVIIFTNKPLEITVSEIPKTRLKLGLDLVGGSRALVTAENKSLSEQELNDLISVVSQRLNVYGISDVTVAPVSDLSGNRYMLIEIAGATPKDLEDLISHQGKFEAKIGNQTVFVGGKKDITSVGRNDAKYSGIERCGKDSSGKYYCNFRFAVFLSEDAAKRHAEITKNLEVNQTPQGAYLSKKLDLYLDDKLVDSLLISSGLKGRVTTQISISGSGTGSTQEEALKNAKENMNKLQTILITGSLPYKLKIVKLDTISPTLGKSFISIILIAGLLSLFAVAIVVFVRYQDIKYSLSLLLTSIGELTIILGVAAFINWNLDLPSIAGILATIGTGIDSQIIVLDESTKSRLNISLKQKIKRAFSIIIGAYFTSVVALLPLLVAGAGLLKGFAITTMIGITIGVFITRPAFADLIKLFERD